MYELGNDFGETNEAYPDFQSEKKIMIKPKQLIQFSDTITTKKIPVVWEHLVRHCYNNYKRNWIYMEIDKKVYKITI